MSDLEIAINLMQDSPEWVHNIFETNSSQGDRSANNQNEVIASHIISRLFLARWIVLSTFIDVVMEDNQGTLPPNIRHDWLLLQLDNTLTTSMISSDIFTGVMLQLSGASPKTLALLIEEYSAIITSNTGCHSIHYIIDEAQAAGEACMGAFSSADGKTKHPVLRPIIQYFEMNLPKARVIVSGTGFSLELFKDVVGSAVAKPSNFLWSVVSATGNFFEQEVQLSYVTHYLPPTYLVSDSGRHLKTRIRRWLRGRCVARKVLPSQLIRSLQTQVYSLLSGRGIRRSLEGQLASIPP